MLAPPSCPPYPPPTKQYFVPAVKISENDIDALRVAAGVVFALNTLADTRSNETQTFPMLPIAGLQ